MPRKSEYRVLPMQGWPGGLNRHAPASRLEPEELAEAYNVRIGSRGELIYRGGYQLDSAAAISTSVDWIKGWRTAAGVDHKIAVDASGNIFTESAGTYTDTTFNTGTPTGIADFGVAIEGAGSKVYISDKNIATDVRSWDGATHSTVADIPKAKLLFYRHARLFAINDDTRPSGIYYSAIGDPESFAALDYIEVEPDDGFEINAATVFGDDLLLFKDNAIHKLSGRTPSSFALYAIDRKRGSVSPRAMAQLRGLLYFFDRNTGIWAFDGATFTLVSQPFNKYLLDNLHYDTAHLASMYVGDDRLYVTIPTAANAATTVGSWITFCFHGDTGAWTEYEYGFKGATEWLGERYLGIPGSNGVWIPDATDGNTHPAALTGAYFRTPRIRISRPGYSARLRRIEAVVYSKPLGTIIVAMWKNFDDAEDEYMTREINHFDPTTYTETPDSAAGGSVAAGAHANTIAGDACTTSVTWAQDT